MGEYGISWAIMGRQGRQQYYLAILNLRRSRQLTTACSQPVGGDKVRSVFVLIE
jgi:hypothetical protein